MSQQLLQKRIGRRTFLGATAAGAAFAGGLVPSTAAAATKTVKIGFLAPLTGEVSAWGLPGLYGCEIWAEKVNAAGGVQIGDDTYTFEFVSYDNEYAPEKARAGATKLIFEDDVKFIMMLGGDTWPAVQPIANKSGMLVSTLLPSDLSPDTTTLIAPCEVHPIYNVTGVWWLADQMPDLKSAVICAQDDALGRPSVATYLAAFEAHGIDVQDTVFFDPATSDFAPVMTSMLSKNPDILCLDTAYADYVHPLCEQAYQQGFKGKIISCTADFYEKIVEKTSKEFMEGVIFQFPDFDDPALSQPGINFDAPGEFYAEYSKRWPGEWGAVSWEYASIMGSLGAGRPAGRQRGAAGRPGRHEAGRHRQARLRRRELVGQGAVRNRQRAGRQLAGGGDRERQGRHQGVPEYPRVVGHARRSAGEALHRDGRDVPPARLSCAGRRNRATAEMNGGAETRPSCCRPPTARASRHGESPQ